MTHLDLESSIVTENTSELTEKLVRCGVVGVELGVDRRHSSTVTVVTDRAAPSDCSV